MSILWLFGSIAVATAWFYVTWVLTFLPPTDWMILAWGIMLAFIPGGSVGMVSLPVATLVSPLFHLAGRRLWRLKTLYLVNSYYCFRDDVIYNPDFNSASPELFIAALYSIQPQAVAAWPTALDRPSRELQGNGQR
jgi:hypothetical protein